MSVTLHLLSVAVGEGPAVAVCVAVLVIVGGTAVAVFFFLVDWIIRLALLLALGLLLGGLGELGRGLLLIAYFLLEWLYPVLFEGYSGRTPGKVVMNLRVVSSSGLPLSWAGTTLRNLIRVVDFLPFLYLGGLISMLLNGRFQRLGGTRQLAGVIGLGDVGAVAGRHAGEHEQRRGQRGGKDDELGSGSHGYLRRFRLCGSWWLGSRSPIRPYLRKPDMP